MCVKRHHNLVDLACGSNVIAAGKVWQSHLYPAVEFPASLLFWLNLEMYLIYLNLAVQVLYVKT